jgi:hypothetical protein
MTLFTHETQDGLRIIVCLLLTRSSRIFTIVSQLGGTTKITYCITASTTTTTNCSIPIQITATRNVTAIFVSKYKQILVHGLCGLPISAIFIITKYIVIKWMPSAAHLPQIPLLCTLLTHNHQLFYILHQATCSSHSNLC